MEGYSSKGGGGHSQKKVAEGDPPPHNLGDVPHPQIIVKQLFSVFWGLFFNESDIGPLASWKIL